MTIGVEWAWVIPALSASAFVGVALFGRWLPMRGAFVSVAAILLGFVLFWFVLADLLENGGGTFSADWLVLGDVSVTWGVIVDRLSVTMIGLVTFVALLVQVYSIEYMRGEPRYGWYFASHALFAAAMLALVLADNLVFLYLAWELVGLGSYLLIGFWHEKRPAAEAAKKAFVTTRIGDVGLLIGIILLYRATGTFDISGVIHAVENGVGTGLISQGTVNLAMFLVFLGAMGKSAQFPFHVWLPDAMEGPTPVSALIHAATMVAAGVFLVARLMPLFEMAPAVLLFVAVIGLFTFAFAGTLALVMTDLKRVLAYSTISHLGLMMLSLGAFGMAVAMLHLIIHGVSKALLFLGAGSVTHGTGRTDIREMGGLWRSMPITAITFTIAAASLAGLVPFSGFFSKEEVLVTVLDERGFAFFIPTFAAALLSALYMARVTFLVFFGKSRSGGEAHESPWLLTAPLIVLAPLALALGLATYGWSDAYQGFGHFLSGKGAHASPAWLAGLSAGLVSADHLHQLGDLCEPALVAARRGTVRRPEGPEGLSSRGLDIRLAVRDTPAPRQQVLRGRGIPVGHRPRIPRAGPAGRRVRPGDSQRHRRRRPRAVGVALCHARPKDPVGPDVHLRHGNGPGSSGPGRPLVAGGVMVLQLADGILVEENV